MTIKAKDIISKVYLYLEDTEREMYTEAEVLSEVNSVRREYVSPINGNYARKILLPIYEGKSVYEFPSDIIRMTHLYVSLYGNRRPLAESYIGSSEPSSLAELAIYRERVSANEIELLPAITTELLLNLSGATGESSSGIVPDYGSIGDLWTDEDGVIHHCSASYSTGSTTLSLTTGRSTPLVFTAVAQNAYIDIVINLAGDTGTSTLTKSGTGTYEDPFVYSFSIFSDDSSNDSIIALLSGDTDLAANGSDASNVTVTSYGPTPLQRTSESNWTEFALEMHYRAELPDFYSVEEEIHPSIQNPMRSGEAIAKLVAANLLTYARGNGDIINALRGEGLGILSENSFQTNRRMGPSSFRPAYGLRR
jgi:hypothetical protein